MSDLDTLRGKFSAADALDNYCLVIGESKIADGDGHAFAWYGGVKGAEVVYVDFVLPLLALMVRGISAELSDESYNRNQSSTIANPYGPSTIVGGGLRSQHPA